MDITKLEKRFINIDNEYFEKIQKIAVYEISHAFMMATKEKELQIEVTKIRRQTTKV